MAIAPIPLHSAKTYPAYGKCIYCDDTEHLSDEHIIPLGLGGRWVLPKSSCEMCSKITGRFEGRCLRTSLGPMRMHFDFPSRRKSARPNTVPLKAKKPGDADWVLYDVSRSDYPFLFTLPIFELPELLNGPLRTKHRDATTRHIWIRAPNFSGGLDHHLDVLCRKYGFTEVFPEGRADAASFCRLLAKIAHSFAVAEFGPAFIPYLREIVRSSETSDIAALIGGERETEPRTDSLHEVSLAPIVHGLIAVRIRILAHFGAPTYFVVAGRRL